MTTSTLKEINDQIAALQVRAAEVRKTELAGAVVKVRTIVDEYGLTAADIFPSGKSAKAGDKGKIKAAPKYRDPATGTTWSGRGLTPKWMRGKEASAFLIEKK